MLPIGYVVIEIIFLMFLKFPMMFNIQHSVGIWLAVQHSVKKYRQFKQQYALSRGLWLFYAVLKSCRDWSWHLYKHLASARHPSWMRKWRPKSCNFAFVSIGHVNTILSMYYFTGFSRNTQSILHMPSLTESVWVFRNNALWDTH